MDLTSPATLTWSGTMFTARPSLDDPDVGRRLAVDAAQPHQADSPGRAVDGIDALLRLYAGVGRLPLEHELQVVLGGRGIDDLADPARTVQNEGMARFYPIPYQVSRALELLLLGHGEDQLQRAVAQLSLGGQAHQLDCHGGPGLTVGTQHRVSARDHLARLDHRIYALSRAHRIQVGGEDDRRSIHPRRRQLDIDVAGLPPTAFAASSTKARTRMLARPRTGNRRPRPRGGFRCRSSPARGKSRVVCLPFDLRSCLLCSITISLRDRALTVCTRTVTSRFLISAAAYLPVLIRLVIAAGLDVSPRPSGRVLPAGQDGGARRLRRSPGRGGGGGSAAT